MSRCLRAEFALLDGSDDEQRPLLALRVDAADAFGHDAEAKHLHAAEGEHDDGDAGPSGHRDPGSPFQSA